MGLLNEIAMFASGSQQFSLAEMSWQGLARLGREDKWASNNLVGCAQGQSGQVGQLG